jgi:hypothetical protein
MATASNNITTDTENSLFEILSNYRFKIEDGNEEHFHCSKPDIRERLPSFGIL